MDMKNESIHCFLLLGKHTQRDCGTNRADQSDGKLSTTQARLLPWPSRKDAVTKKLGHG